MEEPAEFELMSIKQRPGKSGARRAGWYCSTLTDRSARPPQGPRPPAVSHPIRWLHRPSFNQRSAKRGMTTTETAVGNAPAHPGATNFDSPNYTEFREPRSSAPTPANPRTLVLLRESWWSPTRRAALARRRLRQRGCNPRRAGPPEFSWLMWIRSNDDLWANSGRGSVRSTSRQRRTPQT
jgi:hypothetical protein